MPIKLPTPNSDLLTPNSNLLVLIPLILLLSCEREINIDYRTAAAHYVAEASVTPEGTTVRLTTTQPMDTQQPAYVDNAEVSITNNSLGGMTKQLSHTQHGVYTAYMRGMPGWSFTLDIHIDGQHYTSTTTMPDEARLASFRFVWKDVLSERILFAEAVVDDHPNQNNYYFLHLYRNNIGYRWAVMRDDQDPGGQLKQLFSCTSERQMQSDAGDADVLHEGDVMRLDVRSIDHQAYDYLYSLQMTSASNTNPISNFTGGMLGYFSAYSQVTRQITFHLDEVEEEEE